MLKRCYECADICREDPRYSQSSGCVRQSAMENVSCCEKLARYWTGQTVLCLKIMQQRQKENE